MVEGVFKQGVKKMSEQIRFSNDENCLIIKSGKFAGEYQTKKDDNACVDCAFDYSFGCFIDGMLEAHCSPQTRKDGKSIIWIKKEKVKMIEEPTPAPAPALQHRHFDLIVAWAKNPTQIVWMWSGDTWEKIAQPSWTSKHYAIGEKPTMPPVKMVKYDGGSIEFPKPAAKIELEMQSQYWAATIYGIDPNYWTGHSSDWDLLDNGLIQLTKLGAEKQSEALVELLKNHAQKWG